MIITSLVLFILSNAVINDVNKYVIYKRLALQALLFSSFIIYNNMFINSLDKSVGIYGGMFGVNALTQGFDLFIMMIACTILILTSFDNRSVDIILLRFKDLGTRWRNVWREKRIYFLYVLLITFILYIPFRVLYRLSISSTYLFYFYFLIGIGTIGVFTYIINVLLYKNTVSDEEDWLKYLSYKLSYIRLIFTFIYCILFTVLIGILIHLSLPTVESFHKEIITFFMYYIGLIYNLLGEHFSLHEMCVTYPEDNKSLQASVVSDDIKKKVFIGKKGVTFSMEKDNRAGPSKPRSTFKGHINDTISRESSPEVRESPPLVVEGLAANDKGKRPMTMEEVSRAIANRGRKRLADDEISSSSKRQRTNSIDSIPPIVIDDETVSPSKQIPIHTKNTSEGQLHKGKINFIIDPVSSDASIPVNSLPSHTSVDADNLLSYTNIHVDSSPSETSSRNPVSANPSRENSVDIPSIIITDNNNTMPQVSPQVYYKNIKPLLNEYEKNRNNNDTKSEEWLKENWSSTPRIKAGLYDRKQLYPPVSELLPNAKLRSMHKQHTSQWLQQRDYRHNMTKETKARIREFYKPETYVSVEDVKEVELAKQKVKDASDNPLHTAKTRVEYIYELEMKDFAQSHGIGKLLEYYEKRVPADHELSPAELVHKKAKSKTQPGEDYLIHVPVMKNPGLAPYIHSDRVISTEAKYLKDIIDPYDPSLRNSSRWDFYENGSVVPFCFRNSKNMPIIDRSILHLCIGPNIMENWHKSILGVIAKHNAKGVLDPGISVWKYNTPRKFYNINTEYLLKAKKINFNISKWLTVRAINPLHLIGEEGNRWIEPFNQNPNHFVQKIFGYKGDPTRIELYKAFTSPNSEFKYNLVYKPMDVAQRYTYLIFDPGFGTSVYTNELIVWEVDWLATIKHPASIRYHQLEYYRNVVTTFRLTLRYMNQLERVMAYIEYRGTILTSQEGIDALSCMLSLKGSHDYRMSNALKNTMIGCRDFAQMLNDRYIIRPLDNMKEVLFNYLVIPEVAIWPRAPSAKVQPTVVESSDSGSQEEISASSESEEAESSSYNSEENNAVETQGTEWRGRLRNVRAATLPEIDDSDNSSEDDDSDNLNEGENINVADSGSNYSGDSDSPNEGENISVVDSGSNDSSDNNNSSEDGDSNNSNEAENINVADSGSNYPGDNNNSNVISSGDEEGSTSDKDSTDSNPYAPIGKGSKSKWTAVNR